MSIELDVSALVSGNDVADWAGSVDPLDALMNAIEAASDQDQMTWLTENGKRVAAVVPVDVAEAHEQWMASVLATGALAGPVAAIRRIVQERLIALGHPDMAAVVPASPGVLASYAGLLTDAEAGRRVRT